MPNLFDDFDLDIQKTTVPADPQSGVDSYTTPPSKCNCLSYDQPCVSYQNCASIAAPCTKVASVCGSCGVC